MASASSTLRVFAAPYGVDNTQRRQIINGTCILSPAGTYVNSANISSGIPLFWGNMQDGNFGNLPTFQPQVGPWGPTNPSTPLKVTFYSRGNLATLPGYTYIYNKIAVNGVSTGSTTLRIFSGTTELTNAASITADNIDFEAEFVRQL